MFRCKASDGKVYDVTWNLIKRAWVPVVTICNASLYRRDPELPRIPNVTNLELEAVDGGVNITWTPHFSFHTEIQVKIGDEDWVTLDLVEPNVGEA